ncbi:MAG: glycoside hydrolase family 127 protein [Lachnospiraceae bacterium]|nr:glycoside hydrolase family 127 protein [Lachnospiraceae bacterium]
MNDWEKFSLYEVQLQDDIFRAARDADIRFMKRLHPDRLLSGFRRSAGLSDKGYEPYNGWEDSRIGGHTMGHFLAACAQAVTGQEEPELKKTLNYLVHELRLCQEETGTGFLFGAKLSEGEYPEQQFDSEEGKAEGETWVPWYTLHKILDGLLTVSELCGNTEALHVAENLGDWVYNRVSGWSAKTRRHVLGKEYGGMNDCLYRLAHQSGEKRHRKAAKCFDDVELMEQMTANQPDTFNGYHANTAIPKFLGALEEHEELAEKFWERVTKRHAYATGGISDMEHFHEDYGLDQRRTQCNCEGCCAHNMLKLSHLLFERKSESKYADYSERLLHNAILGAINTENGTTAYFSPMATGYRKTFGEPEPERNMFWCCTGTGMENYTKVQEEIYFQRGGEILINQYIDSEVKWKGICLTQKVMFQDKMTVSISLSGVTESFTLCMRVPKWAVGEPEVYVEGEKQILPVQDSMMILEGVGKAIRSIQLHFGVKVQAEALPDEKSAVCFTYGPYVLAAVLGREKLEESTNTGIDVVAAAWKVVGQDEVKLEVTYGETHRHILPSEHLKITEPGVDRIAFLQSPDTYMQKIPGKALHFTLTGTNAEEIFGEPLRFVPYYEIVKERYGIYWYLEERV